MILSNPSATLYLRGLEHNDPNYFKSFMREIFNSQFAGDYRDINFYSGIFYFTISDRQKEF